VKSGLLITFEGTEGSGKSTQIKLLEDRIRDLGRQVVALREPGGTAIGEEIRHTLQHSQKNQAMTPETELLLVNASRAQLVREVIRPSLDRKEIVLCDRFYDSTIAYQGYGRGLELGMVRSVIDIAVGHTHPHLTLLLQIPLESSEERLLERGRIHPGIRDRMEEADREFFKRVERGFLAVADEEPARVRAVDGRGSPAQVHDAVWELVRPLLQF
jgi:dTMP kinase